MKKINNLSNVALPLLGASSLFWVSCSSVSNTYKSAVSKINQPISNSGYNPLDRPGKRSNGSTLDDVNTASQSQVNTNDYGFNNGDIVEVVIPNTALFAKVPKAGDRYKKVLKVGATLRVVGGEKDFIKVVTESGETGYVSSVMVVTQGFLTQSEPDPSVSKVQSFETPIVPDIAPEPEVRGIGTPDDVPSVAPAEVPNITAPVPVPIIPSEPDPGLSIPGVPSVDVPDTAPVPNVPDLDPIIPSIPDVPDVAPDPTVPGLPQ